MSWTAAAKEFGESIVLPIFLTVGFGGGVALILSKLRPSREKELQRLAQRMRLNSAPNQ